MTRRFCDICGKEIKRAVMPDKGREVFLYSIERYDKLFCSRKCFLDYITKETEKDYSLGLEISKFKYTVASDGADI